MITPDYPFRIEFEVNSICNINCVYCYAQPFSYETPSIKELEYIFLKTKKEADPFEVVLLGGEPFMRRDVIELIETASGIFDRTVGISTNGTLLSALSTIQLTKLKRMSDENKISLQVSLDSINPEINNKTRGKTLEIINGLNTLEKAKIPFHIGIVLTKVNKGDVVSSVEYLLSKYNHLVRINLELLVPTLKLGEEYHNLILTNEEMRHIQKQVIPLTLSRRGEVDVTGVTETRSDLIANKESIFDSYNCKTCTAGLIRAGVFSNGDVGPCLTIRDLTLGNLYTDSWKQIWERSKTRFFKLEGIESQCFVNLQRTDDGAKEKFVHKTLQKIEAF